MKKNFWLIGCGMFIAFALFRLSKREYETAINDACWAVMYAFIFYLRSQIERLEAELDATDERSVATEAK